MFEMDDLYRDYILEHYRRPHKFGVLEHANASHEGANPLCGDRITLQLRLSDGKIAGVGFTGRGCAISQASASLLTDEIKGKPVADVAAFRADDLLELLGIEISPARSRRPWRRPACPRPTRRQPPRRSRTHEPRLRGLLRVSPAGLAGEPRRP